jgi:hypothetical protein
VGALPNVTVTAGGGLKTTLTDATGTYRLDGLVGLINLAFSKQGYESKEFGMFGSAEVWNVTMFRKLQIVAGDGWHDTIHGDENIAIDDVERCHQPPFACKSIRVTAPGPGRLTVRLAWVGPANQLGVRILSGGTALTLDGPGVSGMSPLEVSADVRSGDTFLVVNFDSSGGATPPPAQANQAFDLATSFTPR